MTPGRYLQLRREAAGLSIDGTVLDARDLAAIEADERAPTDIELQALIWSFPLSIGVLTSLAHNLQARCNGRGQHEAVAAESAPCAGGGCQQLGCAAWV